MKIITLNNELLDSICKSLTHQILASNYRPDLILGIETGGVVIAKKIFEYLNWKEVVLNFCTPIKKNNYKNKYKLNKILKSLPIFILNFLRLIEAKYFFNKKNRGNFSEIKFPQNINDYKAILIIDDAVDTGETLSAVIESLRTLNNNAEIKTAVLTITKNNPVYSPDYYIYNNQTLLRFPWSKDAK